MGWLTVTWTLPVAIGALLLASVAIGVLGSRLASVVDRLEFSSLGTDAAHDQPTMVEFQTGAPFRRRPGIAAQEMRVSMSTVTSEAPSRPKP